MVCLYVKANDMEGAGIRNNRDRASNIAVLGFAANASASDSEAHAESEQGIGIVGIWLHTCGHAGARVHQDVT